jgi:hypothetical protein
MSSFHYWAIPPQSRLYARLQEDRAFNSLMASLFPYGCGIYLLPGMPPQEMEHTFEDIVKRHRAVLGPKPEARRRIIEINQLTIPGMFNAYSDPPAWIDANLFAGAIVITLLGIIFICLVPLVFIMKRPRGKAAVGAH